MKLPLTMAIIDGMIIQIGTERYIVPTIALKESLRLSKEAYFTVQGRGELVKVRDSLMPLVRLHSYFNEEPKYRNPWEALLMVVTEGQNSYCLLADEIVGRQEVVIKSLGDLFQQLPGISGGAILGDGKIALIIDVKGIISLYEESIKMIALESQDWDELVKLLKEAEESVAALASGTAKKRWKGLAGLLSHFIPQRPCLVWKGLEKAGVELERIPDRQGVAGRTDSIAVLGFAVSSVIDQIGTLRNGGGRPEIDLNELLEILRPSQTAAWVTRGR